MTEEEMAAWQDVTEDAARNLADTVLQAAGETLLRSSLRELINSEPLPGKWPVKYIYMALMAATYVGYECGIAHEPSTLHEPELYAVIALPTGKAVFPLEISGMSADVEDQTDTKYVVGMFLGS